MPAIDLRDGCCVQLVGGSYDNERVRLNDPLAIAARWRDAGFDQLHVVDLDAATGRGSNRHVVNALLDDTAVRVQVGGGIREDIDACQLLERGAERVVVGTRAMTDPEWLASLAECWPDRIVLAADVRSDAPVLDGWTRTSTRTLDALLRETGSLPLAAILVTAVHAEGRLLGPDLSLVERVVSLANAPVIASGGIRSIADLHDLRDRGACGAVVGLALYTGTLNATQVVEEFAT